MNLQFNTPYASINQLVSPANLPDFVILTGENGSGKSHLLAALTNNSVIAYSDQQPIDSRDIVYVPFGALNVTGGDSYSSQMAHQACDQVWGNFISWRQAYNDQNAAGQIDFTSFIQRYRNVNDQNQENIFRAVDFTIRAEVDLPLSKITKRHFWKNIFDPETSTAGVGFFEQNFAKLFAEYQVSLINHRFFKFMDSEGYEDIPSVNEESLQQLESNKPWDFVNEVLSAANFDFEVVPPDFWDTAEFDYKIVLRKKSSGAEVIFSELSTGEQVLFALALVRYKAEKRSNSFPALMLLDEPDAPLHPVMTESMISVLRDVFVGKYNTKVIVTTHSPATVALAPEQSVFTIKASGQPNTVTIDPASKEEALSILASGFVAITSDENQDRLSFEINRTSKPILFVEGPTDKVLVETAWKKIYPGVTQPFITIPCGDFTQIRFKIDATTVDEFSDREVVAVMDFDSAYDAFNGLKNFIDASTDPMNCLAKKRQNGTKNITCLLLPVPTHRNSYASPVMGSMSKLSIELLFEDDVLTQNNNLTDEALPGGATVKIFQGSKSGFAGRAARLDDSKFIHFKPLLEQLKNIF